MNYAKCWVCQQRAVIQIWWLPKRQWKWVCESHNPSDDDVEQIERHLKFHPL